MSMPQRLRPPEDDPRTRLMEGVERALRAIPLHFSSPIFIEGIEATDLFSMNQLLGGAIETQTVAILNLLRTVWDPDGEWMDYEFIRFPESFPDVRLMRHRHSSEMPLIGIELKGWYLLSKERMPSFRFSATPMATSLWDLIACFPWALTNVISGKPELYEPYVESARYAAAMRNYYWLTKGGGKDPDRNRLIHPVGVGPYPSPRAVFHDTPVRDRGGNFGRIARVRGLMSDWINESLDMPMAGINAVYWIRFFKMFAEGKTCDDILKELDRIESDLEDADTNTDTLDENMEFIANLRSMVFRG